MSAGIFVVSIVVALGVSFFCSLLEATLLSLTPSQLAQVATRYPSASETWRGFKSNIEKPIAAILILNTTAHTVGASVAGAQFDDLFGDQWIWLFSLFFTFVMLQYTEILPKTLGIRLNQHLARWLVAPLSILVSVLRPVIHLVRWINRPFEVRRGGAPRPTTLDEIISLAAMARHADEIDVHHERVILGAAALSRTRVTEIMIATEQVVFLSTHQPLPEIFTVAQTEGHTRFPVCTAGDRDRVLGYVNFKELTAALSEDQSGGPEIADIVRPVLFVNPDWSAAELLRVFVEQHEHLAIVQDATGRTLGLVTMEDIIEKLVGPVQGEWDRMPRHVHPMARGTWLIGGGLAMRELAEVLGHRLTPEETDLGSWLERELGRLPGRGDILQRSGFQFEVCRMRRGKVFEIRVAPLSESSSPPGDT